MTPASLNAAANWTHVRDQLTAHARAIDADDSDSAVWARRQAAIVRADVDQLFADVDQDLLRQIIVRSNAMLGDIAYYLADGDDTADRALAVAQTVMGYALFGGSGKGMG